MDTLPILLLFAAVILLAYANGANDNFKGVATLYGSGVTSYRTALGWATAATMAGSLCSLFLAEKLVRNFSGKGLVPDGIAASPDFLLAVALGAAGTVLLATFTGFPVSTTHAITGALLGTGVAAAGSQVNFGQLGQAFFLPLAVSPILALSLSGGGYAAVQFMRRKMKPEPVASGDGDSCLCAVDCAPASMAPASMSPALASLGTGSRTMAHAPTIPTTRPGFPSLIAGTAGFCSRIGATTLVSFNSRTIVNAGHFLSAGLVSFARGLNDTPKLAGLLVAFSLFGIRYDIAALAAAIAIGGLINARKVATTMSRKITPMEPGSAFAANLVTAAVVIGASRLGLPVSTTHVSVGSISGVGILRKTADIRVLTGILLSWMITLPAAALSGWAIHSLLLT